MLKRFKEILYRLKVFLHPKKVVRNSCGGCGCSCECLQDCKGNTSKCPIQCNHHCNCYIDPMVEDWENKG